MLQVLKESLRMFPTAPAIAMAAKEDTTIGGQYTIKKRNMVIMHALALHRDKAVWGEDADRFNPDHFAARPSARGRSMPSSPSATGSAPASAGSSRCRRRCSRWA